MNPIEVLVECGTTYQPLTIGLQLLKNTHDIKRVHLLTTYSAYDGARLLIEEFFPDLHVIYYGEFVDADGKLEDQHEFRTNIASAISYTKHPIIGLLASGTGWMTWMFSRMMEEFYATMSKPAKSLRINVSSLKKILSEPTMRGMSIVMKV